MKIAITSVKKYFSVKLLVTKLSCAELKMLFSLHETKCSHKIIGIISAFKRLLVFRFHQLQSINIQIQRISCEPAAQAGVVLYSNVA